MLGSGACVALFGAAYFWQIHSMWYFISVQVVGGAQLSHPCGVCQGMGRQRAGAGTQRESAVKPEGRRSTWVGRNGC